MGVADQLALSRLNWPATQQQLEQGATLITANRRQAQVLLLRYAEQQSQSAWARPTIVAWPSWQQQLFEKIGSQYAWDKLLLEDYQCEWLWQRIIDRDSNSDVLLNRTACSQAALTAWQLTQGFNLGELEFKTYQSAETTAFLRWAKQYTKRLEKLRAVDKAQLSRVLLDSLGQQLWQPPEDCIVYGFERWLPAQKQLLLAMQSQGCRLNELTLTAGTPNQKVIAAADQTQELIHAANWAKQQFSSISVADSYKPVAIVIPDLHLRRAEVESVLTTVLHPRWDAFSQPDMDEHRLFDISAAVQLADDPVIALAFCWLSLLHGQAAFSVFSRILRSPLLVADESQARARLEIKLRDQGMVQFRLTDVMLLAGQNQQPWHCPLLQQQLRTLVEARKWFLRHLNSSEWQQHITSLLATLEWPLALPDQQPCADMGFALQESWQQLLDQFERLTVRDELLSGPEVLQWLQRLARGIPLQRARPHAYVQVLGLLEALGQRYSAVWVIGMSASNWPPPPQPNPFLPVALQRHYAMPQASAEQELQYAKHATRSLLATAPELVFSYPLTANDAAQLPSPLIRNLVAEIQQQPEAHKYPHWQHSWQQRQLESYQDPHVPLLAAPITDLQDQYFEDSYTHGGSGLLKAQAQCPFQAVAAYRLAANPLEEVRPGISALQHGNIIHAVLQIFWQSYVPEKLSDVSARDIKLRQCIQHCLEQNPIGCLRNPQLQQAYGNYLQGMLGKWLAVEATRAAPFRVVALEQVRKIQLGPLKLKLRIDRIDELEDGGLVVMDYKSGAGNPKNWCDERLTEPQLPLYALNTQPLGGVVFANLKPGQARFQGFTLAEQQLPGVKPLGQGRGALDKNYTEWSALQADWQTRLVQLADDYHQGVATVDPYQNACRFCRRQSLCRINTTQHNMLVEGMTEDSHD